MILQKLCEAYAASPDGKVRLECGCLARPTMFKPCEWHKKEFQADLLAVTEDAVECNEACCDPG
jgi:hypothetical protein